MNTTPDPVVPVTKAIRVPAEWEAQESIWLQWPGT
ncbi:MAG: agmatine deiminase family protein, partial [Gammaproteobacteria bacterium]|nr:agmatine deiminase family protein [Gammaproteobacteria bacterium]